MLPSLICRGVLYDVVFHDAQVASIACDGAERSGGEERADLLIVRNLAVSFWAVVQLERQRPKNKIRAWCKYVMS